MRSKQGTGWYALLAATAAVGIANSVVFSVLSDLQDKFGFADAGLGLIAGSGMVVGFAGQLLLAPLADRGHSKRLLIAGLLVAVVGSVLFASSSSLLGFIIARGVVGLSNGLFIPAARAIAASMSDVNVAERLGRLGGIELAGFVTGPVIGGVLVGPLGVRWPFLVCGAIALAAAIALAPRSLPAPPTALRANRLGLDLLRLREMQIGVLLTVALFFPVGMYDAILDRYLTDRGASNVMIGISFTLYGIPFALLAARGGRLADRKGAFKLSLAAIALVVPLTAAYGLLTVPVVIMCVFFLEGTVQALGVPASQAVVAAAAPLGRASAAQGLSGSMNLAAAAVSAFTAPIIYERWGAGVTFSAAAVLVAVCGALAASLRPPVLAPAPASR
ncbi:MAG: major facilitator superfamily 1 [Ilumatobacteraceae bacterium]|nr:major facilitator superfamily 1 [Ilumatobacteraceae bacterium]